MISILLGSNQNFNHKGLYLAEYIRVKGIIGVDAEERETREYQRAVTFKACFLNAPFFRVSYELRNGESCWIADFATKAAAEKQQAKLHHYLQENRKVANRRSVEDVIASVIVQYIQEVPINPRQIPDLAKKCFLALSTEGLVQDIPTCEVRK